MKTEKLLQIIDEISKKTFEELTEENAKIGVLIIRERLYKSLGTAIIEEQRENKE